MWWYTRIHRRFPLLANVISYICVLLHSLATGRALAHYRLRRLRRDAGRGGLVSVEKLMEIVKTTKTSNSLVKHASGFVTTGSSIDNSELRQALRSMELGLWRLSAREINHLHNWVLQNKPSYVLEMGSGVSTLVNCHAMSKVWGGHSLPRVYSLEQDQEMADQTKTLLQENGLDTWAQVIYAPVGPIEGMQAPCYRIPEDVQQVLREKSLELCLIDGPSTSRRSTAYLVQSLLNQSCYFMLDDALRDSEVHHLEAWSRSPGIDVLGVLPVDMGLACGWIRPIQQ